ncbi:MAG: hypothetical protein CL663_08765 [Bacteroidetes bacterium]|nr:hypothetical protein [Bacteroidota bacterium]
MEYILIILVAFGAALLTFVSGFGLGTILLPVFAIFFPVEIAIALTAVVHLLNNIFKTGLMYKHVDLKVFFLFAIPASIAAFIGASILLYLVKINLKIPYQLFGMNLETSIINIIIAALLICFAILEMNKNLTGVRLKAKWMSVGGFLSGFFGGLSGHQGALRSMFLLKAGLSRDAFIATGIATAIFIDISRLIVYGSSFLLNHIEVIQENALTILLIACGSAFLGSFLGRKLLKKVTLYKVQMIVASLILVFAILLGIGLI